MKRTALAALTALSLLSIAVLCAATAHAQDMLVGEYYTNKVWRVSPDGTKTAFAQPSLSGGSRFFGSAFDSAGNLYAARASGGPSDVIKISPTDVVSTFHAGLDPTDVAFDLSGNLYVASGGQVSRFAPNGTNLGVFATVTGDASGQAHLNYPLYSGICYQYKHRLSRRWRETGFTTSVIR